MFIDVMGFLGVSRSVADKIVTIISLYSSVAIIGSIVATFMSAGTLAVPMATLDLLVLRVKKLMLNRLRARAVAE